MSVDLSILEQRRASLDSQPLDERERHEYREALGDLVGFDDEQLAHVTAPLDDAQLIGLLIYERNVEARHSRMDAAADAIARAVAVGRDESMLRDAIESREVPIVKISALLAPTYGDYLVDGAQLDAWLAKETP